ncbi:LacI family DNA-binding transcriptional regulator [Klebsiella pneumoniae]|nr:LacI family DNA-binding transcriptional regulator [Klebsiella pneumoniae]MEB7703389.1 LacI family DNA-binding transcriptional regulator [Klebsiella pneumoniae]
MLYKLLRYVVMAKKINFSRIAELAGVSTTTVSHIFNGNAERHRISDITKKKVLAIATQFADQEHIRRAIIRASLTREGANKQVISSQADSLIKISRIWADFFPANTSNQPI